LRNFNTCLDRRVRHWTLFRLFVEVAPGHALRLPFHLLVAGLVALCSTQTVQAIDPNRTISQYVRQQWGIESGFPRGAVYAIDQTADGYLWIGTEAGLVRFDGLNFSRIPSSAPQLPSLTHVLGLATDDKGDLWARLRRPTLLRYRDGMFENVRKNPSLASSSVTAMSRGRDGALLFWGAAGAVVLRRGKFQTLPEPAGFTRSTVLSIAQTENGDIWVGTRDAGLFRMSGGQTIRIANGLPDLKVNSLAPAKNNRLWVATDGGIALWDGTKLTQDGIPRALDGVQALATALDRDSNLWIGTNSLGLVRLNDRGIAFLEDRPRAKSHAVTAVFEDREGDLWIGSANHLERLRDSAFVTYSLPEGLPTDGSKPVYVDSENRVWFPPVDGGLWWLKDGRHGRVTLDGLDKDVVYSIAGRSGELWLGRQHGGLTQLRPDKGSFTAKTYTHANGLAQDSVYSVYQDHDGSVWAGTVSGGVSKLSGGRFTTYTIANGLASDAVTSILESSDGTMWFATPSGISALSREHWRTYTAADGLPAGEPLCLLEDSAGILWIGTRAGIAFRDSTGFHVPRQAQDSLREQILGMAEDKSGSLWISTSNHMLRVNRAKLWRGALEEGDLREYGLADGLRGVEGVKRQRSVVTDPLGRIWLSLNFGISVVDPARLTGNSAPAIAHVETISADGSGIGLQGAIHIPGGRKRITFGYAGLSLSVPERVRFRYKLDAYDRDWSEPVTTREAAYTNLPPGSYRFRVVASNPDGAWSGKEAMVAFNVLPLFWQTWWFQLGVVAVCMLATVGLYRLRLRQMTGRLNLRFEERLAERTRIAQELHDTLLQGFLSASMQVHVAADRLTADSPAKPSLTRALQLMRQVIEEGRNAVRGLRSSQSASLDLEEAFSRIREEQISQQPAGESIDFRIIVDGQRRPLHPVLRDELYRIGREALINAFHRSRAKRIEIELMYSSRRLRMLVRDDGCGIAPQVLRSGRDGHWGLPGMRERAEGIGARLHVFSSAAAGTEIELSVPGDVAFQGQSDGSLNWFGRRRYRSNNGARQPGSRKPQEENGESR
jgi:ligand-binding sensor domain-containing protein/signal transduction histidine kinase